MLSIVLDDDLMPIDDLEELEEDERAYFEMGRSAENGNQNTHESNQ